MLLEMPRDKTVFGADEMQHLDDGTVGGDGGAGREDDREHGGGKHEQKHADAEGNDGSGHRTHTLDKAAMVIEGYTWDLLGKRLPQLREIGRAPGRDTRHDQARDRQIIELKSASQPWLEQVCGLFLGIGPHLGNAWRSARDDRSLCDLHVDVVTGHRTDLNRDLARRSEEHTSELQSHVNLVCRLLLEKKNTHYLRRSTRAILHERPSFPPRAMGEYRQEDEGAAHASLFFFFNDTATTEIYTLSLHDALPIFDLARVDAEGLADVHRPDLRPQVRLEV